MEETQTNLEICIKNRKWKQIEASKTNFFDNKNAKGTRDKGSKKVKEGDCKMI